MPSRNSLAALPHYSTIARRARQCSRLTTQCTSSSRRDLSIPSCGTAVRSRATRTARRRNLRCCRIEQIYTPRLQESYLAELQNIAGLCNKKVTRLELKSPVVPVQSFPSLALNEFLLYHGAPSDKIQRIVEQGLDPRNARLSFGALFGSGSYFAAHSSKSDIYTKPNNAGERCILVARVCLGEPHFEKTDKPRKEALAQAARSCRWPRAALVARRGDPGSGRLRRVPGVCRLQGYAVAAAVCDLVQACAELPVHALLEGAVAGDDHQACRERWRHIKLEDEGDDDAVSNPMAAYCKEKAINPLDVRFMFQGSHHLRTSGSLPGR